MTDNYKMSDIRVKVDLDADGNAILNSAGVSTDWFTEVRLGNVPGWSIVQKHGAGSVSTTLAPITRSGAYMTPTTAQSLEFVSDSADDTANGIGAREITIIGLDGNWEEITQVIATNGLTAVALPTNLTRLYRWYVSASGTYATATNPSHVGTLTIRAASAGATWSTIEILPIPVGQSQIGVFTIAKNSTGYVASKVIFADTTKTADFYLFSRDNADVVTPPYTGVLRLREFEVGVTGGFANQLLAPLGPFVGPCDLGFMAKVDLVSADVSVEFEILIRDDTYFA